jgi:hypothetical protein
VIVWLNAESILLKLGQDEAVAYRAGLYIRYLAVGLPGYALNLMMRKSVEFLFYKDLGKMDIAHRDISYQKQILHGSEPSRRSSSYQRSSCALQLGSQLFTSLGSSCCPARFHRSSFDHFDQFQPFVSTKMIGCLRAGELMIFTLVCSATLAIIWALFFAPKTAWNGWGGFTGEQALFLFTQGSFGTLRRRT